MIRVIVGTEDSQYVPQQVLKYSILKHASVPVDIRFIQQSEERIGGTNFGFVRFHVPEIFDYEGRAIYLDADQLVLDDISELWRALDNEYDVALVQDGEGTFGGKPVGQINQTSVMVLNCERLRDWNPRKMFDSVVGNRDPVSDGQIRYRDFMTLKWMDPGRIQPLEPSWNHFNIANHRSRLVHFSHVRSQPWRDPKHTLAAYWKQWLEESIAAGELSLEELQEEIDRGHVSNWFGNCTRAVTTNLPRGEKPTEGTDRSGNFTILIDDTSIGKAHLKMLIARLSGDGPSQPAPDVQLVSNLKISLPNHWQVEPAVARSLAAKLSILNPLNPGTQTLYLSANCVFTGDLASLPESLSESAFYHPGGALVDEDLFFAAGEETIAEIAQRLLMLDYDIAANFSFAQSIETSSKLATSGLGLNVYSCRPLSLRPWYTTSSPSHEIWLEQIRRAIADGTVTADDIEDDISTGTLSPDIARLVLAPSDQIESTIRFSNPYTDFVPSEVVVPSLQLKVLRESKFIPPQVALRKKLRKKGLLPYIRKGLKRRLKRVRKRLLDVARKNVRIVIRKGRTGIRLALRLARGRQES